jgi:transketolase
MKSSLEAVANTLSLLSCDAVQRANSGHPGLPMGASLFSAVLWSEFLRYDPNDHDWIARDRFVLSAGHGSALLYSLLHLFSGSVSLDDLKQFRQWDSKTPGHPEFGWTSGVEATTGPLGQGTANAVGLALGAKMLADTYKCPLLSYRVFALVSDGDLMEGIASEAASLAGHLKLDNLVFLYDDNKVSLAGMTDVCFTESVEKRFASYGWDVQSVDGHDEGSIRSALKHASQVNVPAIICLKTIIGYGSSKKAGTCDVHGSPLGLEELANTKRYFGVDPEASFCVPREVESFCAEVIERRRVDRAEWQDKFSDWSVANPEHASSLSRQVNKEIPDELKKALLAGIPHNKPDATRNLSGKAIQLIADNVPYFVGGSADLESSTKTLIVKSDEIQAGSFSGRNIRYGVREHAMGAIANGLAYTGAWIPMVSTFLVFSDYLRPTLRLAALSHIQTLFVFTHDSFWVGEDGPTHQPIEHIMSIRLIPGVNVYRPADGLEMGAAYFAALERKRAPSVIICTRQNVPVLERGSEANVENILRGGYHLSSHGDESVTLVATGSEVGTIQQAAKLLLEGKGIGSRVVSIPCVEDFLSQNSTYQKSVIPSDKPVVIVEAGSKIGWSDLIKGSDSINNSVTVIGMERFGASASGEVLAEKFGFTPEALARQVEKICLR